VSDPNHANATDRRTMRLHLEAARHAAHHAADDDATLELLSRLNAQAPRSVRVQRLLIDVLLRRGRLSQADRLLAEALLLRPRHRGLILLQARCCMLHGDWTAALAELHELLQRQPGDSPAHELAGEAAAAAGDHELAGGHFAIAAAHASDRTKRRELIARAHLETGDLDQAAQWLDDLGRPAPRLSGLLAGQRGQWVDAAELLSRAAAVAAHQPLIRQLCLRELIEARRQVAAPAPLRAAVEQVSPEQPLARAAAAEALIGLGEFRRAAAMMLHLLRRCPRHRLGWHVLTVAAVLDGRTALASRSLGRSARRGVHIDPMQMARLWRTGLLSRLIVEQRDARRSGSDPDTRMLAPLLRKAVGVFERQLRTEGKRRPGRPVLSEPRRQRLRQHRSACLAALGEPVAALYGLQRQPWACPTTSAAA